MERVYQRRSCYLVTCSTYNGGWRKRFKYINQFQLIRESLERNHAISVLSHAIALPLFPLLASPLLYTFGPHFASFTEYLTPVNPPKFFSHVLTERSKGAVSGRVSVNNNKINHRFISLCLPVSLLLYFHFKPYKAIFGHHKIQGVARLVTL